MNEEQLPAFLLDYQRSLIGDVGLVLFFNLIYWIACLWVPLRKRASESRADAAWLMFCLFFGLFVAVVATLDWGGEFVLVGISLGISLGLALTNASAALSLCVSLLFVRPWEMLGDNDYFLMLPKLTFAICIGHLALIFAARKSLKPTWSTTTTFVVVYAIWVFVTTFKSPDPSGAQAKYVDTFFKSVFIYMMVLNFIERAEELRMLIGTVILTFLGVGTITIYRLILVTQLPGTHDTRLSGTGAFGNANDIAALMVLVFPFALSNFVRKETGALGRLVALALMVVSVASIILSQSRAAMLALAGAMCLYVVRKIKNRALTAVFVAGLFASIPGMVALTNRSSGDLSESSSSRLTYVKTGLVMGVKNPVLGVGYERFPAEFEHYATEILFEWGHRTAHNSWILAFAETGLLGLLLFACVFATSVRSAWRIFPRAPEFLLSVVGYGICISFLSHTYLLYPYLLYGFVGVADRVYKT